MPVEDTDGDEDEVVLVNFRVTERFLDQVDATWRERGFNSRSEFIRYALRQAAETPVFDREELFAVLAGETELPGLESSDSSDDE